MDMSCITVDQESDSGLSHGQVVELEVKEPVQGRSPSIRVSLCKRMEFRRLTK